MLYSKGDLIESEDESIVLVLDDGMGGVEFVKRYLGLMMNIMGSEGIVFHMRVNCGFAYWSDIHSKEEHVWYPVLLGDKRGWITKLELSILELDGF